MAIPMTSQEVLDREFLEIRAKLLELAASLDRLDRADGSVVADPRMAKIAAGLATLSREEPGRAEQIQMTFSLDYAEDWQDRYKLKPRVVPR